MTSVVQMHPSSQHRNIFISWLIVVMLTNWNNWIFQRTNASLWSFISKTWCNYSKRSKWTWMAQVILPQLKMGTWTHLILNSQWCISSSSNSILILVTWIRWTVPVTNSSLWVHRQACSRRQIWGHSWVAALLTWWDPIIVPCNRKPSNSSLASWTCQLVQTISTCSSSRCSNSPRPATLMAINKGLVAVNLALNNSSNSRECTNLQDQVMQLARTNITRTNRVETTITTSLSIEWISE